MQMARRKIACAVRALLERRLELLGDITKIVARERIRSQNAIAMPELYRVMREMGWVVETFVRDPETLERITARWLGIRVGLGAA